MTSTDPEYIPTTDAPAGTSLRALATEQDTPAKNRVYGRRALVTLEGPGGEALEPFEVRIDNRDYIRWDKTATRQGWVKKQDDAVPIFLMTTFLAWSAATRAGLTDLKFGEFESACLECADQEETEDDAAGPTR